MRTLMALAPIGERAHASKPDGRGSNITMIGALSMDGMLGATSYYGYMNGDLFLDYIKNILLPELQPKQVLLMDNLSAHKKHEDAIRTLLAAKDVGLRFLPPYSPDYSPIELAWSWIKQHLRKSGIKEKEEYSKVFSLLTQCLDPSSIEGWFKHAVPCSSFK